MHITAISTAQVPSTTANSIQVMKVCQALAQNGHKVRLCVPGQARTAWSELARLYGLSEHFAVEWLPSQPRWQRNDFAWKAARKARAAHKANPGAHWVYTWSFQAAVLSLLGGQSTLLEVHDLPTGRLGPFWLRAFLRLPGRKRLVMITRALQDALEKSCSHLLHYRDMVIAPNGVDLERYANLPAPAEARAQLGLEEGLTIACSGHLYAGRGGELFLALAGRFPERRFLWVGGRPEDVTHYRGKAEEMGLQNAVFCGHVPQVEIPLYQAAANVLLMPYGRKIAGSGGGNSVDICSPMKMFDYLAAGRVILSSDLPVVREVLDEECARFAPPEDVEAWSKALARLLDDGALRVRLGARAKEIAPQYAWKERERLCLSGA
jgi:glycosyltransferase involved in cell wall biosynthesis